MPGIETALLLTALVAWLLFLLFSWRGRSEQGAVIVGIVGIAAQFIWTGVRVAQTRHAPFSGAYESLVFFGLLYGLKILISGGDVERRGKLLLPVPVMLVAALLLPPHLKQVNTLVPALRSFWIYIHVPAFFVGYVALTMGTLRQIVRVLKGEKTGTAKGEMSQALFFLSLGMITGAFWGEAAWDRFWSWDAKEIWALVTWLAVAAYFHARTDKGRLILSLIAFLAMVFTYFGVMFLLPGLHAYR